MFIIALTKNWKNHNVLNSLTILSNVRKTLINTVNTAKSHMYYAKTSKKGANVAYCMIWFFKHFRIENELVRGCHMLEVRRTVYSKKSLKEFRRDDKIVPCNDGDMTACIVKT